jgi:hypothetical protein
MTHSMYPQPNAITLNGELYNIPHIRLVSSSSQSFTVGAGHWHRPPQKQGN